MCKVISIINNKGGVGKTTSTGVIAELLSYLGQQVLIIDLDQQSNLSMLFGNYVTDTLDVIQGTSAAEYANVADIFRFRYRNYEDIEKTIYSTAISNLSIIPSSSRHKNTQNNLAANTTGNNNIILKRALAAIKNSYDFILIDNAPANDVLTVNSMIASDLIFVPACVDKFSYKGLKETIDTILYIKEEYELDSLQFGGAFITKAESNTTSFKKGEQEFYDSLGCKFLHTSIRKDVKMVDIAQKLCPILTYCPDTNAVFDYAKLILEMGILNNQSQLRLRKSIGYEEEAL